jgi:hypothetical protein
MKRLRLLLAGAALIALIAISPALSSASWYWKLVRTKSTSGDYALTSATKTVRHPRGLAVRFSGGGDVSGSALVSCSRGFHIATWSRDYSDTRLHKLPMMWRASGCDVIATVSGDGYAKVQIYRRAR